MIKNRKFICINLFVAVLLLTVFLSPIIGIVMGEKPDKPPGKPSPEPEIANFKIWIGIGDLKEPEDVVLTSPVQNGEVYLERKNVPYEHWTLPTKIKRKDHIEWGVQLLGWEGDDCGTYNIAEVYCDCCESPEKLTDVLSRFGIDNTVGAYLFGIYHILDGGLLQERADYWKLFIEWDISSDDSWHVITLVGDTDKDLVPEGTYNEDLDTWTVYFNEARFSVYETGATGPEDYEWTGQLSFTVEIKRTLGTS